MIPLRDNIPSRRAPVVSMAIIAVNVMVFLYEVALPVPELMEFIHKYGVVPAELGTPGELVWSIVTGRWGRVSPLATAAFVHGGWLHLIGNMWYLWVFADNVEDFLGRGRFILFYVLSAVMGNYAQVLADPASTIPMVGASGAVAAILGGYLLLYPGARVIALVPIGFFVTVQEVPALFFLFIWFLLQLISGVASIGADAVGGVAWWAHVGGFVVGMVLMNFWRRRPAPIG